MIDEGFIGRYVLQPRGGKDSAVFDTLNGEGQVRVEDGKVVWQQQQQHQDGDTANILYSETHYDEHFNPIRVVTIQESSSQTVPSSPFVLLRRKSGSALSLDQDPDLLLLAIRKATPAELLHPYEERLDRLKELVSSTFSTAALARHGALAKQSIEFFCKHAWELSQDWSADVERYFAPGEPVAVAVECVVMHALYPIVIELLVAMHADHDAVLAVAQRSYELESAEAEARLASAVVPLVAIAQRTTPYGKLQCAQRCVDLLMKWLGPNASADDLLPSLMAVIVRCPIDALHAHFSFIQFHNSNSAELKYFLTTVRAALEYIRNAGQDQPPMQGVAEGASLKRSSTRKLGILSATPSLETLRSEMCAEPDALLVKDRWYRLRRYRQVFVASEFVDWIVLHYRLVSRQQATLLGRQMVMEGIIRHVVDLEKQFEDDYLFFRWTASPTSGHSADTSASSPSASGADNNNGSHTE